MTDDEYIPNEYRFESYRLELHGETLETWAIRIPVSELIVEDIGCYLSLKNPMSILESAQHRWGVLQRLWPVQADVQANRLERTVTIDGIDYRLDATRVVWIGPPAPGGPDHLRRGGFLR